MIEQEDDISNTDCTKKPPAESHLSKQRPNFNADMGREKITQKIKYKRLRYQQPNLTSMS